MRVFDTVYQRESFLVFFGLPYAVKNYIDSSSEYGLLYPSHIENRMFGGWRGVRDGGSRLLFIIK